jgi:hypothetical protein
MIHDQNHFYLGSLFYYQLAAAMELLPYALHTKLDGLNSLNVFAWSHCSNPHCFTNDAEENVRVDVD